MVNLYLYCVYVCVCVCDRMTFSWSTMTKGPVGTNWATPGRPLSGTEHRWETHLLFTPLLSLPPPVSHTHSGLPPLTTLQHVAVHVLPGSAFLSFWLTCWHSVTGLYYLDSTIGKGQLDSRASTSVWWSVSCCFQLSLLCTPFTLKKKKGLHNRGPSLPIGNQMKWRITYKGLDMTSNFPHV